MTPAAQVRAGAAVRAGWGLLLVAAPAAVPRRSGGGSDGRALVVARVLGVRELLQATVTAAVPARSVVGAGAAIDAVHAVTAVGLALVDPRRRALALASAATAAGWAALGAAVLRRG